MKIVVGLNKKIGQANYGSIGANCGIEFEADQSLLQNEEALRRQVHRAYAACAESVNVELARQSQTGGFENSANGQPASPTQQSVPSNGNGSSNGNGHRQPGYSLTEKQRSHLRQLAKQIDGLGAQGLERVAQKMFAKPVGALSSFEASAMIDTLKAIKAGETELNAALGANPS